MSSSSRLAAFEDPSSTSDKKDDGTKMVTGLIQALSGALVYPDLSNFETNKRLWNRYAQGWSPEADFVASMVSNLSDRSLDGEHDAADAPAVNFVGDEWSTEADLNQVVTDYILPCLSANGNGPVVAEIGVGGGRVAAKMLPSCSSMVCFDISKSMLTRAEKALKEVQAGLRSESGDPPSLEFVLLETTDFSSRYQARFDFVYCFDVMVHMDLHNIWKYFQEVHRLLRPGGKAFFSTANLLTPGGWERFVRQSKYTVGGFYFLCPEMVNHMLTQAGFRLCKSSSPSDGPNVYYQRDYLTLVERLERGGKESDVPSGR